jgi:beta-galactosidase
MDREKSITSTFEVPYVAGELIASCYENGKEAATQSLKTTGKPTAIRLLADRTKIKANCNDLSFIRAEIIDSEGNIVPDADDIMISFDITGEGCLAGAGSGNPLDMSSFQQPKKKTWKGICMVIVRTGTKSGKIRIRATAAGLKSASITISAERCGK